MPDIFDERSSANKPADIFDQRATETKQEPFSLKGAASAYGSGLAGGAGGVIPDIISLVSNVEKKFNPIENIAQLSERYRKDNPEANTQIKGTHALSEELGQEPNNAAERILRHAGEFGGQEGLIGGAVGGPVGGALGTAHGSISGTFYGAAKELGASEEVALLAALATLSPVAANKLISKFKLGRESKAALKGIEEIAPKIEKLSEEVPPVEPPPPPPGGIGPGSVIPETKSAFDFKESVIDKLNEVQKGNPLGVEAQISGRPAEHPSLQGRVSEAPQLGEIISQEPFQTEAQAGRSIAQEVTQARDIEREIVREKYKKAEEITSNHEAIYPKLAKENQERIERLGALAKRSAGEEAVYQDAIALRDIVGYPDMLYKANADRLMKQANSFSQKVKYELPYAGYKGEIKKVVHEMNEAVIESLEHAGKPAELVRDADKTFGKFADRFMNKDITPYFQKKIKNPEELARHAVADNETYRSIKSAIGSRKTPLLDKIDREIVHSSMDKYYQDPNLVNSKEYVKDLSNLQQKIGKEKVAEVDLFLREKNIAHERKQFLENKIKESEALRKKEVTTHNQKEIREKISGKEPIAKSPEDIDRLFKSRSGIRKLRTELRHKGLESEFDTLRDQKIEELFKEGGFGEKKVTGQELKKIIDKDHEILSELLGEEEISLLYKAANKAGKEELTDEIIKQVIKAAGKTALQFAGLGKLIKLIPLNRI